MAVALAAKREMGFALPRQQFPEFALVYSIWNSPWPGVLILVVQRMTFSPELEEKFDGMLKKYPQDRKRSAVIPMLLYAQDEIGSITRELVEEVARRTGISPLQVDEVVTYYSMLHRKRLGRAHVQICTNISCMLNGGTELWQQASKHLGIGHKETSADGSISLEEVECIGACSWAPAIQVNYDFYHQMTPQKLDALLTALEGTR